MDEFNKVFIKVAGALTGILVTVYFAVVTYGWVRGIC